MPGSDNYRNRPPLTKKSTKETNKNKQNDYQPTTQLAKQPNNKKLPNQLTKSQLSQLTYQQINQINNQIKQSKGPTNQKPKNQSNNQKMLSNQPTDKSTKGLFRNDITPFWTILDPYHPLSPRITF